MDIVKIEVEKVGGEALPTVNARELRASLGITKDFSTWVKAQIKRARLVENIDFVVFTQKVENLKGGRPTNDYHLTLESAKHISMMSGSDKGIEVRDYFLKCEKELRLAEAKKLEQSRSAAKKVVAPTNEPAQILGDFDAIPCRPVLAQPGNWEEDITWLGQVTREVSRRQIWHARVEYVKLMRAAGMVMGLADYERLLNMTEQPLEPGQREKMGPMVQDRITFAMQQMLLAVPFNEALTTKWYAGDHDGFRNEVKMRLADWVNKKN